jgi:hypothetical protein
MEGSLVAYKVFTNGSVLNASEINDNLMNQSVIVFSNAAARTAAITSPIEGMITYLEDTEAYESYSSGAAWVPLITPSTSGLTLLASQTFTSATSVTVDNVFSATYNSYKIIISALTSSAGDPSLNFRVGGVNATSNYGHQFIQGNSSSITGNRNTPLAEATTGRWDSDGGLVDITIHGVALAQRTYGVAKSIDSSLTTRETGFTHTTATAYDGVRFVFPSSTGEIRIYGLEN